MAPHRKPDDSLHASWRAEVRVDRGRLRKAERTPSGGVRVPAAVSRAGILEYRRADGEVVRELVPEEEVGDADALHSLRDAAVTVGHPADGTRMVTPETYREDAVGHVTGEPGVEDGHLVAQLAIQDAETIRRIDAGELTELSAGYQLMIDPTPGVWNGQRYDQVQRRRRYNHVALLPKGGGRAGATVALRLDGVSVAMQLDAEEQEHGMNERIDGVDYKVGSPEWAQAHAKRMQRLDEDVEAEKKKAAMMGSELETMKAERDAMKAKLDEMDAKMAAMSAPERTDALVSARLELLDKARRVLGADFGGKRTDGSSMPDREVHNAVLAKLHPATKWDEADPVYVRARFDAEIELLADRPSPSLTRARADAFVPRTDAFVSPHADPRFAPSDISTRYRRD